MIYDADGAGGSDGRRPLSARAYYARLTQALITALTAPMAEGRLYEADMRLRPSGHQGPVATGWQAFRSYQQDEAWVWEHLALTRARAMAGPDDLAADIETFRRDLLARKGARDRVLSAVADMRRRIKAAKNPDGPWDAKIGPGRMQEIELVAQAGSLMAGSTARDVCSGLAAAVATGWLDDADRVALDRAYGLCWAVLQAARLLGDRPLDPRRLGEGAADFLLRETGADTLEAAEHDLAEATQGGGGVDRRGALHHTRRKAMTESRDPLDPKGLIREAYRIDGITAGECRSIFLDWALSLPDGQDSRRRSDAAGATGRPPTIR